jgi:hypothetical protein
MKKTTVQLQEQLSQLQTTFNENMILTERRHHEQMQALEEKYQEALAAAEAAGKKEDSAVTANLSPTNSVTYVSNTVPAAPVVPSTPICTISFAQEVSSTVEDVESITPIIRTPAVTPAPGSIARKYLDGTPGARPISWLIEQVNTEVKRQKERESILMTPGVNMKIAELQKKLAEAMTVIQEQDRLIQQGKYYKSICFYLIQFNNINIIL